ncbi:hypothetical protein TSTA_121290 [Talaromyces stipitatus ATCC 10500]|uniref:RRM domain-containing protein n=1 Tax=Talaromyces stipitatus (strain ATCC 10500 / CBS 375.48 / QM 6759 / NRRL 1006) TaxID=441959 RepID=B8MA57_TALSN|nr:uncharacterized protein TSTA_121290 [Talaromyces stipitatus ATCC 10500]EED18386.1 hypothetical protein TSTA_121290 [Talaromyces stipitatus ATCC 10500]
MYGTICTLDYVDSDFADMLPCLVMTNRGTAYILYNDAADAESAVSNMHEAQIDGATTDRSHPEDTHLAMNIHLGHHRRQEDDLQDATTSMVELQTDMTFTAQDRCRVLHHHDAPEPVHILSALTRVPHQGEEAHREGVRGIVDVEVQATVATAQGPVTTLTEAAAQAGPDLRGLTTDGNEPDLSASYYLNLLVEEIRNATTR